MLFPGMAWLLLFFFAPLGIVLLVSFATRGLYGGVHWSFTLENYTHLLDAQYVRIYVRSFLLAAGTTLICLVVGFPLAYYMARLPARRQLVWLLLVLIPFWTNFLIRTYGLMFILGTDGVLNTTLVRLGLLREPIEILYTDLAILIGLVYGYLPFMVLPLYAVLSRLDLTVVEAARDLYASRPATFWKVIVPLAKPGIVGGSVLVFVPSVGAYVTPDILGGARTMMIGNLIQHEYLVIRDWPLGSAISFVLMVLVVLALAIYRSSEGVAWKSLARR
jgi:spermidine/putrescine transport system permease protein